jgi:hypothetical protein
MIKKCDECGIDFDIFAEGKAQQFFIVCGNCWSVELKSRKIGGVK